jgi:hypothetical protein
MLRNLREFLVLESKGSAFQQLEVGTLCLMG